MQHFYPRSPRGERPQALDGLLVPEGISIHAPREGSDWCRRQKSSPLWHFYPRSPRGERLPRHGALVVVIQISIHAPREGSDAEAIKKSGYEAAVFLSTLPARGATPTLARTSTTAPISIHAPREGSDSPREPSSPPPRNFYPRSPRGERQIKDSDEYKALKFLSTLPARGATYDLNEDDKRLEISIHAPREGSDSPASIRPVSQRNFYPRSPRGERRGAMRTTPITSPYFYPRSPRGERLSRPDKGPLREYISIHAPREGSDALGVPIRPVTAQFLSTLPARGATGTATASNCWSTEISIHAPREGSDADRPHHCGQAVPFLSTLPARGATLRHSATVQAVEYFYPRSPRGERPSS